MNNKLAIIMVGLPARGKTFLSLRLQRYLSWQGIKTKIFNVGNYRRDASGNASSRSDFFDPNNKNFAQERERLAKKCFGDLADWLRSDGDVAIYDATNVTKQRREYLKQECVKSGFKFIFVENICDDDFLLDGILDKKIKTSADYNDLDKETARRDFIERIGHYSSIYKPLAEDTPTIKIYNFGEKAEADFDKQNTLLHEIFLFLKSINLSKKNIYLTRHGEALFNQENRIGGDSALSDEGIKSARKMAEYFNDENLIIFTSQKQRSIQTANFFKHQKIILSELNEINSGICDSMSYDEIAVKYPEIAKSRNEDKFNYRYPNGESYYDLILRLRPVICKIEASQKDVLIIAHRAINRCLFSYFSPVDHCDIPHIDMPLDKMIKIMPKDYGFSHEIFSI